MPTPPPFVAIDFETADHGRDSACAVALVRVEGGRAVEPVRRFIRPPRRTFEWTHVHGIAWKDVAEEPSFPEVWRGLSGVWEGVHFFAAHNASFDRGVLRACCDAARLRAPDLPFVCTVALARTTWDIRPTTLPDVCRRLRIALVHHEPASDALACAEIVLHAARAGWRGWPGMRR